MLNQGQVVRKQLKLLCWKEWELMPRLAGLDIILISCTHVLQTENKWKSHMTYICSIYTLNWLDFYRKIIFISCSDLLFYNKLNSEFWSPDIKQQDRNLFGFFTQPSLIGRDADGLSSNLLFSRLHKIFNIYEELT